jgi:transcriptional regulator with XRE-family HTH domain
MDMKKFGSFIRTLRKEKELTQEQLAQQMHTSARTVSRWETGANLPDLDVLVNLSDYFAVDIRELIDGERKGEQTELAQETGIQKVAEYSRTKDMILTRGMILAFLLGVVAWSLSLAVSMLFIQEVIGGVFYLLLTLAGFLLYSLLVFLRKANRTPGGIVLSFVGAFAAVIVSHLWLLWLFFRTGEYYNHGIIGLWYSVAIFLITFSASGCIVSFFNNRNHRNGT